MTSRVWQRSAPSRDGSSPLPSPDGSADFDLFLPLRSAGSLENPYPIYSVIRTVRPVLEVPVPNYAGPGAWMLTRYRDVHSVLRDPRFSVERLRAPLMRDNLDRMPEFLRQSATGMRSMLVMDPPDHTRVRKLVNKAFTPKRVAALRGHIEAIVGELADEAQAKGTFDLIHDVAEPLPAIVIAELLGVPAEDHRQFRQWSSAMINGFGSPNAEARATSAEAARQVFDRVDDAAARDVALLRVAGRVLVDEDRGLGIDRGPRTVALGRDQVDRRAVPLLLVSDQPRDGRIGRREIGREDLRPGRRQVGLQQDAHSM